MRASRTSTKPDPSIVDVDETIPDVTPEEQQQVEPAREAAVSMVDRYDDEAFRDAQSWDDFVRLAQEAYGQIDDAGHVLGDGSTLLKEEDKKRLVGVPLMFMNWNFYPGDFGADFVAARVVARNPDGSASKYIINDGSTGVCDTLREYTKRTGKNGALFARHGLRTSEYTYCAACGEVKSQPALDAHHASEHKRAMTYYIDTAL